MISRFPKYPTLHGWQLGLLLLFPLLIGAGGAEAGFQPDLMVRTEAEGDYSYLGGGLFESTPAVQSKSQPSFSGGAVFYRLLVKNGGDQPDSFLLRGTGSGNGFSVRYLDEAGVDRGSELSGSGLATAPLAPGEALTLRLQVTPTVTNPGASYRVEFRATSLSDPARADALKTETVVCGQTAAVNISTPPDGTGFPGGVVNYPYTVTNVGNGVNSFALSVSGGAWPASLYGDDGAGGGVAGDGARQAGENGQTASTGPLSPGASYRFFLAVTVPQGSADAARAETQVAVAGVGAGASDRVTTTAQAAVISVAEDVRNLTRGGPFQPEADTLPGDVLEYRMTVTNSGSAPAATLAIDTPLPPDNSLLPEDLRIATTAGGDGEGCPAADCGFLRASAGALMARLGRGATDDAGGSLPPSKTLYLFFRVQVK